VRLNPAGVPLRGVAYAAALAVGAVVAAAMPGVSSVVAPAPWYLRDLALPAALAAILATLRIDGRAFHMSAIALLRHRFGARDLRQLRKRARHMGVWQPTPIVFVVDGSESSFRSLRYHGPGVALICCPHHRVEWPCRARMLRRARVSVHPIPAVSGGGMETALELADGAVLEISPRPWSERATLGS
jgi:hypothetical protein